MTKLFQALKGGAIFAAAALLTSSAALADNRNEIRYRDLNVEQRPLAEFGEERSERPDRSSKTKVWVWSDHKSGVYHTGDTLTLQVKTNRPAYITVLDVGTSGKVHVIYPNKYQHENRIGAFEVAQIPDEGSRFRITVGGPAGNEIIKVFATEKPIEYFEVRRLAEEGPFYRVPAETRSMLRDLNVELNEGDKPDYGVATEVVHIVRDSASTSDDEGSYGDNRRDREPIDHASAEQLFKLGERSYYGESGDNIEKAAEYYERAADQGHVLAMVRLGQIYEDRNHGEGSISKALNWYEKAAKLGSTQAMVRLAFLYSRGEGVEHDLSEALSWLTKAAKAGDGLAMARLAKAYDEGRGVAHNAHEAARFGLAAVRAGAWSVQSDMTHFSQDTREEMQRLLKEDGFYHGQIDGEFGSETREALTEYARQA